MKRKRKPKTIPSRSNSTMMLDGGGRVIVCGDNGDIGLYGLTFVDGQSRHYLSVTGLTRRNLERLAEDIRKGLEDV